MGEAGRRGGVHHRGPTQAEVAAHAGVSAQTVSRVANKLANVDPATRDRVLQSMWELRYRRNRSAVALRSGRHGTIGVLAFSLGSFGNIRTLESLALAADRAGFALALVLVERRTRIAVRAAFERLAEQSVDGIVLLIEERFFVDEAELPDGAAPGGIPGALTGGLPLVVIDSAGRSRLPFVDTDQALGARQATEHLLGLGHPTVWHVAGPAVSYSAVGRERSWRDTLRAADRTVPPVLRGDWSAQSGYAAGLELCTRPEVSAVFVANDQMALGVLRALHERTIAVPHRVSVVGFDDSPDAGAFWPPLTTVRQDFEAVASAGIRLLLERLRPYGRAADRAAGRAAGGGAVIPTQLVVRASTAPYHPQLE